MFEQDNSIMRELVSLQREQLIEIKKLRGENYSPSFSTGQNSFSPYSMYSQESVSYSPPKVSFAQTVMDKQRDSFNNSIMNSNMRVSSQQKDLMGIDWANKRANAAVAGFGAGADLVGDFAVGGLLSGAGAGFVGSVVGGIAGGAAVGAVTGVGLKEMKQHQDISRFLFNNSYKYIQTSESNSEYGSGFSTKERQDASSFIRNLNSSKFLKDTEVQEMLTDFTSYNLLRTTTDLDDFKETTSKLIDSTKAAALTLNKTYKEITQMMSDMKKIGISPTSPEFETTVGMFKAVGANTGTDAGEIASNVIDITQQARYGTDISGEAFAGNLGIMTNYMTQLKGEISTNPNAGPGEKKMYNLIDSYGNDTVAAYTMSQNFMSSLGNSDITRAALGSIFSIDKNGLTYADDDKIAELRRVLESGDENEIETMVNKSIEFFSDKGNEEIANKIINEDAFKNNLSSIPIEDLLSLVGSMDKGFARTTNLKNSSGLWLKGMGEAELGIIKLMMGDVNDDYVNSIKMQAGLIASTSANQSIIPGVADVAKSTWEKVVTNPIGNIASGISDAFEPIGRWYNELMYGKDTTYANMQNFGSYEYGSDMKKGYYKSQGDIVAESFNKAMDIGNEAGIKLTGKNVTKYEMDSGKAAITDPKKFMEDVVGAMQGEDVNLNASYKDVKKYWQSQIDELTAKEKLYKSKDIWTYGVLIDEETLADYKDAMDEYSPDSTKFAKSRLQKIIDGTGSSEKERNAAQKLLKNLADKESIYGMKEELITGLDAIVDMKDRGSQSGLNTWNVMNLLNSYTQETGIGKSGVKKSTEEILDRMSHRDRSGENISIDKLKDWETDDKKLIMNTLSPLAEAGEEYINEFLTKSNLEDLISISGSDKKTGWSTQDIELLAAKLMDVVNNNGPKPTSVSGDASAASSELDGSLKAHEDTFNKVAKVMEKETKIMQDILDSKSTYARYFGSYTHK